jgi:DNA-binding transcriptional LysR family regulator
MDRLSEMEAFATVVDQGGFTNAARKMGVSKSAISKHVASLEDRLGATLLNRTTRRVSPTEIGLAYYDRARRVLNDAGEADAIVNAMQSEPTGQLRMSVSTDFGVHHVAPLIGDFLHVFPEITVDMVLNNRRVDLVSEGFDVAIRIGGAEERSLGAQKICSIQKRLVASPSYFQKHGRPQKVEDLSEHSLLHSTSLSGFETWKLRSAAGEVHHVRAPGCLTINDGQSLLNAAIGGLGIAYLPCFLSMDALKQGLLEVAIPSIPPVLEDMHAVCPPGKYHQPKVRVFIDFLLKSLAAR